MSTNADTAVQLSDTPSFELTTATPTDVDDRVDGGKLEGPSSGWAGLTSSDNLK